MYLDGIVVFGLVIVILTCVVIGYVSFYIYRHIKDESAKFERELKNKQE